MATNDVRERGPVAELAHDLRDLLRLEIELVKTELLQEVRRARTAVVLLGSSVVVGVLGVAMLPAALAFALGLVIPMWAAFAIVAAGFMLVSGVFAWFGATTIARIDPVPRRALHALQELGDEVASGGANTASYQQAGHSEAGGDFYDVTPLEDGRIALFVGDVMGRGVTAAAAMAQMRAAIRALVAVEPDPRTVLVAMDRLFDQYDFHQLVTVVYAVLDPSRDELVLANAGHPPPLVRRADGTVEVVDGEPGLLLGAGGGERSTIRVPFREGDLLLGYTDGLVERRDEDIETGVDRLVAACGEADAEDLFVWLADVVLASRDTSRDDDVAVLAIRRRDG